MLETGQYILCGLCAGLLGGYLGLGGGVVMVPFLTVVSGLHFKIAVPVSVTAIVVNSLAASNEYLKRGMVDIELVVILSIFMIMGNITGSHLSQVIPVEYCQLLFSILVLYTAYSLFRNRKPQDTFSLADNRSKYLFACISIALITGIISALLGIGGGIILVPVLYLLIGLPLSTARGTSSLMVGFSAAAASTVYLLNGDIDLGITAPVILGIIVGGKLGGYLGTIAKPMIVRVIFSIVMLYVAFKLVSQSLESLL